MAITLYIPMKKYLAEWLIHKHGGHLPININKCSPEALILERNLRPQPRYEGYVPQVSAAEDEVSIEVPCFKHHDPRIYSYLPARGVKAFRECIRVAFVIELWRDLYTIGNVTKRTDVAIKDWMKEHGITFNDTNYNTIIKIVQRQRVANNGGRHLTKRRIPHSHKNS